MSEIRLGDIIDDYCARCRRLTDHSVVAMVDSNVRKVRCRTCQNEHAYRHGKGAERKKGKMSAYEQVLASITAQLPAAQPAAADEAERSRRGNRRPAK